MTEFDRGMAETAKEMIGDFGFGILEEQSKIENLKESKILWNGL
jgi:hypothetical protein